MKFEHAVRVRRAVAALAATVARGVVASPVLVRVRVGVGPTVRDFEAYGARIAGVERRAERFRGRYQPRLSGARRLVGA